MPTVGQDVLVGVGSWPSLSVRACVRDRVGEAVRKVKKFFDSQAPNLPKTRTVPFF